MSVRKLIVATGNAGKLREIRQKLTPFGIEVEGLESHPEWVPAVEDGETFAANARKKALAIARQSGTVCLADDSGLTVEALEGRPGVYSARFAGEDADDARNNAFLLEQLAHVPAGQRQGAFCCVMALCSPEGQCRLFEGRLEGEILFSPRGQEGFGYDPLFWLAARNCSMAELSLEEKNLISHRGQALAQVVLVLSEQPQLLPGA
ncbi:MAG: XTP/dITP diphosphatase [Desulfuromonadaceae bacterium]|nr:XTP/dITP diphosphatase [Desulfuromonadaceae bacterium]